MVGHFFVLEGTEGTGKSTQARLLAEWLSVAGHPVVLTREPGGTPLGEQIRQILLAPEGYAMLAATEALLYSAARAQHVGAVIRPALAKGQIVVCDRYTDSTLAYQGGGRGLPMAELVAAQALATGGLAPDLRILLDLPVTVGLARRFAAPEEVNRLDQADVAFHRRVRAAYLELVAADPAGWAVVSALGSPHEVADRITAAVAERLARAGAKAGAAGAVAGADGHPCS